MRPAYSPSMIVRPRRWSSPFKGGYVTKQPGNRLVKQANAAYHDQLRDHMMPGVYDAVNAVQETAWKINAPNQMTCFVSWVTSPLRGMSTR